MLPLIIRTLRFVDGELERDKLSDGWRNWRVVEVLSYHEARTDEPRVEYVRCLIDPEARR